MEIIVKYHGGPWILRNVPGAGEEGLPRRTDLPCHTKADLVHDVAWFEKHLADSYDSTDAFTGKAGTKAEYLADVKAKTWTAQSAVISDMKVQAFGDVAVVTGITTAVKAMSKGEDQSGKFRWTDTWVRRAGVWQCVASQSTKVK